MTCHVCGHTAGATHVAREMMFGYRHEFRYFECVACGCVELADVPADMGKYYPPTYYSYRPPQLPPVEPQTNRLRRWVFERRNEAQVFARGGVWGAVAAVRPRPDVHALPYGISRVPGLRMTSRILDVGCGSGELLVRLAAYGFRDLTGVDPYLAADADPYPRVRLLARPLEDVADGPYDLIMFHHSLEHVPDQHAVMAAARRLLAPTGTCLIRIPTVTSAVWRKYGPGWVEFDAPRHFFLHSHDSLRRLAGAHQLRVRDLWCDGEDFGYWGSELYRRDVPLKDLKTGRQVDHAEHFTPAELAEFTAAAAADNLALAGGRLVALLTPVAGGK